MSRSREIVEIMADVVKQTPLGCRLLVPGKAGSLAEIGCPAINYTFGNARYVSDRLDELSKSESGIAMKFPLIALFCPFVEHRDSPDYHSKAKVRITIACATAQQYSNEQRRELSFENVLRPIYRNFLLALKNDGRLDFGYDGIVRHDYSENYSYGRYGALTDTGEEVSDFIDAINLSNLEIIVKKSNCRLQ